MLIRIEGTDLPGRRGGAEAGRLQQGNVQVGVQRKAEVVERVPADAASASWAFEVTSREVDTGDEFVMFRRAKLLFGDIPTALLRAAHEGGGLLVARLGLTAADGGPLCARVRPPAVTWELSAG
jgi:hypothetical protein